MNKGKMKVEWWQLEAVKSIHKHTSVCQPKRQPIFVSLSICLFFYQPFLFYSFLLLNILLVCQIPTQKPAVIAYPNRRCHHYRYQPQIVFKCFLSLLIVYVLPSVCFNNCLCHSHVLFVLSKCVLFCCYDTTIVVTTTRNRRSLEEADDDKFNKEPNNKKNKKKNEKKTYQTKERCQAFLYALILSQLTPVLTAILYVDKGQKI